jgi:tetratricopeptide (TPR) repeat protein
VADTQNLFVVRPADLAFLQSQLDAARGGASRMVVLESPVGGGKRAAVGELVRGLPADDDVLSLRMQFTDEEDGLKTLLRMWASLYGALYRDTALRGKIELMLNAQAPQFPKRVQDWFRAFIEALKKGGPAEGETSFQVQLPGDNPAVAWVEIVSAIARKVTTIVDIQAVHHTNSVVNYAMIEALLDRRRDGRLLTILSTEPMDDVARAWMPPPWIDFLDRRAADIVRHTLGPWSGEEVAAYAASKSLALAAPDRVAAIAGGRPGFVAEVVDVLEARGRLGDTLEGETLATLAPFAPDEDELEKPEQPAKAGQRKHAGAEDAGRVFHLAALLGLAFPSGLVADLGGFERDSVDDLMDACPELFAELQFSKGLGSWVYQFKKAVWRQAVLELHTGEDDRQIGRNVGGFMERFLVPRGYEFIVKTARLYAEQGAMNRASALRGMALGNDRPEVWRMAQDLLRWFEATAWPDPMRRSVFINLSDRMVQGGDVEQAEKLLNEALAWANERSDRPMEAWLLFAGSRLDFRRGDNYRARDRAKDAAKMYAALEDKVKLAEVSNHLGMIEHKDGNANAALDHVREALEAANVPPVQANAEFIRGLVAQRAKKLPEAAEHFRKANEMAGQIGMAPLALEAGFFYGEALFFSNQTTKAADVLQRVAGIAQALNNHVRERSAAALLAQAHAQLRNFEAALKMANRTLQLTQELKFERYLAADIYNVGFFNLALGRATEAASLFRKAKERAPADDPRFLKDLSFNLGVACLRIGEKQSAAGSLREALGHARTTKDWRRVMEASEHLADLAMEGGDKPAAAKLLQDALNAAETANLKEERKGLRRRLDDIGS